MQIDQENRTDYMIYIRNYLSVPEEQDMNYLRRLSDAFLSFNAEQPHVKVGDLYFYVTAGMRTQLFEILNTNYRNLLYNSLDRDLQDLEGWRDEFWSFTEETRPP